MKPYMLPTTDGMFVCYLKNSSKYGKLKGRGTSMQAAYKEWKRQMDQKTIKNKKWKLQYFTIKL